MKKLYCIWIVLVCLAAGCAKMNDKHDEFLARGETVYIGKVDSVRSFPGKERLLLRYWISDPRAKNVTLYWGTENSLSKVLPVAPHLPDEALEAMLTASDNLDENTHTFQWIASDLQGNKSMVFESLATVYGSRYQEKLLNRRIVDTNPDDYGNIDVTWAGASSEEELGVEISYTKNGGEAVTEYHPKLGTALRLEDVDYTQGVHYQTLYLPAPTALDTFYTAVTRMNIVKTINVALGKPVTCNGVNSGNITDPAQRPENAVDGNRAANSARFVSTNTNPPRFLEIDLQAEYTVSSFKTWSGGGTSYNYNLSNFELQAQIGTQWVTVHSVSGNTDALYGADFPSVTTDRIRVITTTGEFRLNEIEIYSVIRY